jgi:hypothetical protein
LEISEISKIETQQIAQRCRDGVAEEESKREVEAIIDSRKVYKEEGSYSPKEDRL